MGFLPSEDHFTSTEKVPVGIPLTQALMRVITVVVVAEGHLLQEDDVLPLHCLEIAEIVIEVAIDHPLREDGGLFLRYLGVVGVDMAVVVDHLLQDVLPLRSLVTSEAGVVDHSF